jgi:CHAD domain-containing protein
VTTPVERELKFDVPPDLVLPTARKLTGKFEDEFWGEVDMVATYFDSPDLRLLQARTTLRRRTGGEDAGWHLKLPRADGSREEIAQPLTAGNDVPQELADLVTPHLRGAELKPVALIETHRTLRVVRDRDGSPIAEIADDDVTGHLLGSSTRADHWREVEIELYEDVPGPGVDAIGQALIDAGATPAGPSKLARFLDSELAVSTRRWAPASESSTAPASAVVQRYLIAQVGALIDLDLAVRRDHPDAVHDMRVAVRRIRTTLKAFRPIYDRSRTTALDAELRWLAASLGEVRDREVQLRRFGEHVADQPSEYVLGPIISRIQSRLVPELTHAREQLLTDLRSDRYQSLLDDLDAFLTDPPATGRGLRPAGRVVPRRIRKAYRKLERRMSVAQHADPGPGQDAAYHRARKRAKRVRYAAEAARPAFGKPAKRLARHCERVQEILGDYQDGVVARTLLRELAVVAHGTPGEASFTFGVLLGIEQSQLAQAERDLATFWASRSDDIREGRIVKS